MFARPRDLDDATVRDAVRERWGFAVPSVTYAAVGFGSHHWYAGEYFVSIDAAPDETELLPALQTARALHSDAGLEFVVAPIPSDDGRLVVPLGDDWLMHLYPRLAVVDDTTHGPHTAPEVVELVRRVHAATPIAEAHALREEFEIWERDDFEEALRELDEAWETGPFGDRCRAELITHADSLVAALARHDRLVQEVSREGWVITHGEPHRGNVFRTTQGWAMVDWDTALVGPAERDWWDLPVGQGDPALRDLYRFRWALTEVSGYVSLFFDDHDDDRNTRESWANFLRYVREVIRPPN